MHPTHVILERAVARDRARPHPRECGTLRRTNARRAPRGSVLARLTRRIDRWAGHYPSGRACLVAHLPRLALGVFR